MIDDDDIPDSEAPTPLPVRRFRADFLFRVKEVVEELRAREGVEILDFEIFEPVPRIVADTVESAMGRVVPTSIRSFYDQTDGLRLRWSCRDGGGGEIDLFGFAEVFGSWLGRLWGEAPPDDEEAQDFSWELRGVDQPRHGTGGFMTVLHMPEAAPAYELYWHEPGGESFRLDCDFYDYVHLALQARGIYGWQLGLADQAQVEASPRAREALERFRSVAREVFPDEPGVGLKGGVSVHHP